MQTYLKNVEQIIVTIISRPQKTILTFDLLDTEKTIKHKLLAHKERQRQMKIGLVWEKVIGTFHDFECVKNHESGLDIISHNKKIAIELKNRTNTDNSSSRKYNFYKLSKFREKNPEYTCIYGNINDNTREKTVKGKNEMIIYNNQEIHFMVGYELLRFIFQDDTEQVISFVRETVDKHSSL